MSQKKIKLPKKKPNVNLPKRPATTQEQQTEQAREQIAEIADSMDAETKRKVQEYSMALHQTLRTIAKARFGPQAPIEAAASIIDQVPEAVTEAMLKTTKTDLGVPEVLTMLASTAGYHAALAMHQAGRDITEGMIKTAMMVLEGGMRMTYESTRQSLKNPIVQAAPKKLITH